MTTKSIIVTNEDNINEITTFVKHITPSGNIRYAADVGNDDTVMTIVNMTSVFSKPEFLEMVNEWSDKHSNKEFINYLNDTLKNVEYSEVADYNQVLRIRRQQMNRFKGKNNWFRN
jgi:hypothetical protein